MKSNRFVQWAAGFIAVVAAVWGRLSPGQSNSPRTLLPPRQGAAAAESSVGAAAVEDGSVGSREEPVQLTDGSTIEAWGISERGHGIWLPLLFGLILAIPIGGLMFLAALPLQLLKPDAGCMQAADAVLCSMMERHGLLSADVSLAVAAALIATALGVAFVSRPQEKLSEGSDTAGWLASERDHLNVRTDSVVFVLSIVSAVVGYVAVFNMALFDPKGFGAALGAALLCFLSLLLLNLVKISKGSHARVGLAQRKVKQERAKRMVAAFANRPAGSSRAGSAYLTQVRMQWLIIGLATGLLMILWMGCMTGQWGWSLLVGLAAEAIALACLATSAAGAAAVASSERATSESRFMQVFPIGIATVSGFALWFVVVLIGIQAALPGVAGRHAATSEDVSVAWWMFSWGAAGYVLWWGLLCWCRYAVSRRAARVRRGLSVAGAVPVWRRAMSPMANYFAAASLRRQQVLDASIRSLEEQLARPDVTSHETVR